MSLNGADVDPPVENAAKRVASLIEFRHATHTRHRRRITRVDGWAPGEQAVRLGHSAIVAQEAQQRIDAMMAAERQQRAQQEAQAEAQQPEDPDWLELLRIASIFF